IWRGFWVQRLLWDIGGQLIFGTSTVKQIRNSHSYIKDMDDEQQLYHQSGSFVRFLSSWSSTKSLLNERIAQLARDIAKNDFWQWKEVDIMDAWIADLESVGYKFPSIVPSSSSSSPSSSPVIRKRAAVCVTGLAECIQEAWAPTHDTIRNLVQGEIDTFLFLSSLLKQGPVPHNVRMSQTRSYLKSTTIILYEDRIIDPEIPSNCSTHYHPPMDESHVIPYYQQLWGLAECFDLVKEYEQKMNIRYELFIRARPDSILNNTVQKIVLPSNSSILIPNENHFGGVNDRFAIGSISTMKKYMRRWHELKHCYIRNIHAETFLKLLLNQFGINIKLETDFSYPQVEHGKAQNSLTILCQQFPLIFTNTNSSLQCARLQNVENVPSSDLDSNNTTSPLTLLVIINRSSPVNITVNFTESFNFSSPINEIRMGILVTNSTFIINNQTTLTYTSSQIPILLWNKSQPNSYIPADVLSLNDNPYKTDTSLCDWSSDQWNHLFNGNSSNKTSYVYILKTIETNLTFTLVDTKNISLPKPYLKILYCSTYTFGTIEIILLVLFGLLFALFLLAIIILHYLKGADNLSRYFLRITHNKLDAYSNYPRPSISATEYVD
ncbi:unnamed protein product, partial [Adineta steineri]